MYAQPNKNKVTYINQLPELYDIEENDFSDKYQKNIRSYDKNFIQESGMQPYNHTHTHSQYPPQQPHSRQPQQHRHNSTEFYDSNESYKSDKNEEEVKSKHTHKHSCLEIADHISKCPICIKFYKTDITIYIVIIAILTLVCLLLLKKILNV